MNQDLEKVKGWNKSRKVVSTFDMKDPSHMKELGTFTADTVNMIVLTLVNQLEDSVRKLSSNVFILRNIIVRKITDADLPYI